MTLKAKIYNLVQHRQIKLGKPNQTSNDNANLLANVQEDQTIMDV